MKQIFSLLCTLALCAMVAVGCSDNDEVAKKTFTVTFDAQGGSAVKSQTVTEGEKASEPAAPTKEGFIFDRWYMETSYAHAWDFSKNVVTENMTLYARWAAKTFTVKFNTNGGNTIEDAEVAEGGLLNSLPTPTKANSAFDGWYTDTAFQNQFDINTPITSNITLYAKWTTVTREKLQELIEEVNNIDSYNYTETSYEKMRAKLDEAKNVLGKGDNATAQEIIDVYQALSKAISELVAKPVRKAVSLEIYPSPIDGVIYINPEAYLNEFYISAYGMDGSGENATNDKVVITYTDLDKWALVNSDTGEKISTNDQGISFIVNPNIEATATASITIKSADDTTVSQTITLKVISTAEAKSKFIEAANNLPAPTAITLDNFEEFEKQLDKLYSYLTNIPESEKQTTEVSNADKKVDEFNNKLDYFWKTDYLFNGNTCIIEEESFEYVANGAFPAGTYTGEWIKDGKGNNGQTEYVQYRMTLNSNKTYKNEYRISNSADGKNPTDWVLETEGEYKITGNQTNGGTMYIHETKDYESDEPVSKSVMATHPAKAKAMRILKK